ncbi:MAG: restriction endonuclease subunit S [Mycobacterium sp.]|uniref:restriction endonuclease subunit S n=1 Tax=Mycobacterium sp. TaxID=1785 RepID=UPI003F955CAA
MSSLGLTQLNRAAAIPGLNREDAYRQRFLLPPLVEQRRIAAILDHADELRAKRWQVSELVTDLPGSIFNEMFDRGQFECAELYEVVRPGTIVTYGIVQAGPEYQGGVPYIRTGDIENGEVRTEGLRHTDPAKAAQFNRSRVNAGDIVMSIRATVGTCALVPPVLDGANLTQGTARISPSDVANGPYLLHYLRSPAAQRWIQAQVKGATFREITLGRLRQLPVPLAPPSLQRQFENRLEALRATRRCALDSADHMDELFASLQSRAFSGQL